MKKVIVVSKTHLDLGFTDFAKNIKGLIIGRFMRNSNVDVEAFVQKLQSFEPLKKIPVVVGFDTGHTLPQMTLPLGQKVIIDTESLSFLR